MATQHASQEQKELFGMIFMLAQRWQYIGDEELKDSGITTKQWFLLVTLHAVFDTPPKLQELSSAMGSSRQNVKQLAMNLKKRGFIEIFQDAKDKRVQRFKLTPKNQKFWDTREESDQRFIAALFGKLSSEKIATTHATIKELLTISTELLDKA